MLKVFLPRSCSKMNTSAVKTIATKVLEDGPLVLVASIGNPAKYDGTRHSIGHEMLGKLVREYQASEINVGNHKFYRLKSESLEVPLNQKRKNGFLPLTSKSEVIFYRVPGYMNLSGGSLKPFYKEMTKYATSANKEMRMVILFDELDLDIGKVKVRKQGSSHRGHNGLRDIQAKIGQNYTGIQIGIGRYYEGNKNEEGVVSNYVLSKFTPDQRDVIDEQSFPNLLSIMNEIRVGRYINDKNK